MLLLNDPDQATELVLEYTTRSLATAVSLAEASGLALAEPLRTPQRSPGPRPEHKEWSQNDAHPLATGTHLDSLAIARLAAAGYTSVHVFSPPCLSIISVSPEEEPPSSRADGRHDPVGLMLAALAKQAGVPDPTLFEASYTLEDLAFIMDHVHRANIVVFTGSVANGNSDVVPKSIEWYGGNIIFNEVNQDPGKSLLFATKESRLLFGIPNDPFSAHLCFSRYVAPAIQKMMGRDPSDIASNQTMR